MSDPAVDAEVEEFFARFDHAGRAGDLDVLRTCFADVFMAADPSGAQPVPLPAFLQFLPRRAELFASAGVGPVTLTGLDYQVLDSSYVLARTTWAGHRDGAEPGRHPVVLLSSFLLHRGGEGLRIVFYLNDQDLEQVLSTGRTAAG